MVSQADDVHIEMPALLTRRERTRDTLFTAFLWMIYVYLWVPLLSLGAWGLGIELAYDIMIRSGGAATLWPALRGYVLVLLAIVCVIVLWSLINRARFRAAPRRRAVVRVTDAEMADWFGTTPSTVQMLRASKTVRIDFDPEGRPSVKEPPDDVMENGRALEASAQRFQ